MLGISQRFWILRKVYRLNDESVFDPRLDEEGLYV